MYICMYITANNLKIHMTEHRPHAHKQWLPAKYPQPTGSYASPSLHLYCLMPLRALSGCFPTVLTSCDPPVWCVHKIPICLISLGLYRPTPKPVASLRTSLITYRQPQCHKTRQTLDEVQLLTMNDCGTWLDISAQIKCNYSPWMIFVSNPMTII